MTDKVIRDGLVAVIYSPGFGSGWSTWNSDHAEWCRHAPELVAAVEAGDYKTIERLAEERDAWCSCLRDPLRIAWVPEGSPYYIHEYDGSEHVVTDFLIA